MPSFYVPEGFRPALNRIASMSDTEADDLRQALASAPASLNVQTIVVHVQSALKTAVAEIPDTIRTLASLSNARESVGISLEQLVQDVSTQTALRDRKLDAAALERRLGLLLNTAPLVLSAKAFDVQHEYEKLLVSARIMTDTRHIFDTTGTEAVGAMIVHNLVLKYSQAGDFREIVIAVDDTDLARLRKLLERAESKTASLEKLIAATGVPYFASK